MTGASRAHGREAGTAGHNGAPPEPAVRPSAPDVGSRDPHGLVRTPPARQLGGGLLFAFGLSTCRRAAGRSGPGIGRGVLTNSQADRRSRCPRARRPDGAALLASMGTVREFALPRQPLQVGERQTNTLIRAPDRQRPHAGRVNDQSTAGQEDQLPMGGDMTPLTVGRTCPVASTAAPAKTLTSVDLPAPESPRSATVRPGNRYPARSSIPRPVAVLTTTTGYAGRRPFDRLDPVMDLLGRREIRLGDHDDRKGAAPRTRARYRCRCGALR